MDNHKDKIKSDNSYFPEGTIHFNVYYQLGYIRFVWDKAKSDKCLKERGFDFRTAAMVFNDDNCLYDRYDWHMAGEERMIALGRPLSEAYYDQKVSSTTFIGSVNSVLYVVYTERSADDGDIIRIISARHATAIEKKVYEESMYEGYDKC